MSKCLFCYRELENNQMYHARCCENFFGTSTLPELHLDKHILRELATSTFNKRIAVTGVRPKLSVDLEKEIGRERLTIVGLWGQYILKPQHDEFRFMPETEDLTMHLANLLKIQNLPTCTYPHH